MHEPSAPLLHRKTIRAFVTAMQMDRACPSQRTDFDGGIRQWKYTKIEDGHLLSDYDSLLTKVKINLNIFLHYLRRSRLEVRRSSSTVAYPPVYQATQVQYWSVVPILNSTSGPGY